MKNVIVPNPKKFEGLKNQILKDESKKFHVLADFDRTLTKCFVNGKFIPSIISILRNENYLSEEYSEKAKALANYYRPIEFNNKISIKQKKKAMREWWTIHFNLFIESGLNKKNLERVINEGNVQFREGAEEFLDLLYQKKIPLIIISSSGIGDLIPMYLKKYKRLYSNIHIITNLYKWDKNGKSIGIPKPVIHSFNKDETMVKDFPNIYKEIKNRKNVLLLGDSIGDLGMITGFNYKNLIKIGFLNENIEKDLEIYKKKFEVIITYDYNMNYVNNLIKEIK